MTREEALKQLKKVIREDPVLLEPLENKLDTIKKRCSSPRKIPQTGRPLWPDMSTEQKGAVTWWVKSKKFHIFTYSDTLFL